MFVMRLRLSDHDQRLHGTLRLNRRKVLMSGQLVVVDDHKVFVHVQQFRHHPRTGRTAYATHVADVTHSFAGILIAASYNHDLFCFKWYLLNNMPGTRFDTRSAASALFIVDHRQSVIHADRVEIADGHAVAKPEATIRASLNAANDVRCGTRGNALVVALFQSI